VGAQFTGQVSAQQNLNVGTFGCKITSASANANISSDGSSVFYDAGTIMSSAALSAPLNFTVTSTGTIAADLTVLSSGVASPFTDLLAPTGTVPLAAGASQAYTAGVSWTELGDANLGKSASIGYVVNCTEQGASAMTALTYTGGKNGPGVKGRILASVATPMSLGSCDGSSRAKARLR
jgi:hypothetical protein